jgi:hypothetical protein
MPLLVGARLMGIIAMKWPFEPFLAHSALFAGYVFFFGGLQPQS